MRSSEGHRTNLMVRPASACAPHLHGRLPLMPEQHSVGVSSLCRSHLTARRTPCGNVEAFGSAQITMQQGVSMTQKVAA